MNGRDFVRVVDQAFTPFLAKLGFTRDPPSISGRLYRASYSGAKHSVIVSFEPGDEALFVLVFGREGGALSDMDDRTKTPRLSDLNSRYLNRVSNEERLASEAEFKCIVARDKTERLLLKSAREMYLVLPRYLGDQAN
jgi:hypothetical protein